MVKLTKLDKPQILSTNETQWTKELIDKINSGNKVPDSIYNKYNQKDIKDKLKEETHDKCMYCESIVNHVAHEHIEHFRPKAKNKYPELTYKWKNLGLACPKCNMNKSDEFDEQLPFVNPYKEDPSDFFIAVGNFIYSRPGNKKAHLTNKILELNRPELIESRKERLKSIELMINNYVNEDNTILKQAILDEILIEIQPNRQYSFCAKSLFETLI